MKRNEEIGFFTKPLKLVEYIELCASSFGMELAFLLYMNDVQELRL